MKKGCFNASLAVIRLQKKDKKFLAGVGGIYKQVLHLYVPTRRHRIRFGVVLQQPTQEVKEMLVCCVVFVYHLLAMCQASQGLDRWIQQYYNKS